MSLTRKQKQERKRREQEEASRRKKLLAALKPSRPKKDELHVNKIPDYSYLGTNHSDVPSLQIVVGPRTSPPKKLTRKMQEREDAAQVEIEKKKKRVAPLYNKSGYFYIDDGVDPTQIGSRKI